MPDLWQLQEREGIKRQNAHRCRQQIHSTRPWFKLNDSHGTSIETLHELFTCFAHNRLPMLPAFTLCNDDIILEGPAMEVQEDGMPAASLNLANSEGHAEEMLSLASVTQPEAAAFFAIRSAKACTCMAYAGWWWSC